MPETNVKGMGFILTAINEVKNNVRGKNMALFALPLGIWDMVQGWKQMGRAVRKMN